MMEYNSIVKYKVTLNFEPKLDYNILFNNITNVE